MKKTLLYNKKGYKVPKKFIKYSKTLWNGVLSLAMKDSAGNTAALHAGHFGAAIGADQPISYLYIYTDCF